MKDIIKHLYPLFIVQFFTWMAFFTLWIYATPIITRYVFCELNADSKTYNHAIIWVGVYFAFYSTLAAFLGLFIPKLYARLSKEKFHSIALLVGSVGMLLVFFLTSKYLMFVSFLFIGIAWGSIMVVPYDIVGDCAPEKKSRMYFAVFNFSVVIPQITALFILSFINDYFFRDETNKLMIFASCSLLLASIIMANIKLKAVVSEK